MKRHDKSGCMNSNVIAMQVRSHRRRSLVHRPAAVGYVQLSQGYEFSENSRRQRRKTVVAQAPRVCQGMKHTESFGNQE